MIPEHDLAELEHKVLLFSGSAHRSLAAEIAAYLRLPLLNSVTDKFSNDNLYVHLGVSVRSKEVFLIQPLTPPVSEQRADDEQRDEAAEDDDAADLVGTEREQRGDRLPTSVSEPVELAGGGTADALAARVPPDDPFEHDVAEPRRGEPQHREGSDLQRARQ